MYPLLQAQSPQVMPKQSKATVNSNVDKLVSLALHALNNNSHSFIEDIIMLVYLKSAENYTGGSSYSIAKSFENRIKGQLEEFRNANDSFKDIGFDQILALANNSNDCLVLTSYESMVHSKNPIFSKFFGQLQIAYPDIFKTLKPGIREILKDRFAFEPKNTPKYKKEDKKIPIPNEDEKEVMSSTTEQAESKVHSSKVHSDKEGTRKLSLTNDKEKTDLRPEKDKILARLTTLLKEVYSSENHAHIRLINQMIDYLVLLSVPSNREDESMVKNFTNVVDELRPLYPHIELPSIDQFKGVVAHRGYFNKQLSNPGFPDTFKDYLRYLDSHYPYVIPTLSEKSQSLISENITLNKKDQVFELKSMRP